MSTHTPDYRFNTFAIWAAISAFSLASSFGCSAEDSTDGSAADGSAADGSAADGSAADGSAADAGASDAGGTDSAKRPISGDKIEIAGVWESAFGGNETIGDSEWLSFGAAKVVKFDNSERIAITQNPADDKYNPSKFNKVVWTAPKAATVGWKTLKTHYCIVDFGKDTAELAEASTKTADDTDPGKSGCGGFSWTGLSSIDTVGNWTTNFATDELITSGAWSYMWLRTFDNAKRTAVTQNTSDAKFGPDTFNKLVWTATKDGSWWYCTVDFGLKTLKEATDSAKTADDTDPLKSGCGGFAWTQMSTK